MLLKAPRIVYIIAKQSLVLYCGVLVLLKAPPLYNRLPTAQFLGADRSERAYELVEFGEPDSQAVEGNIPTTNPAEYDASTHYMTCL